MKKKIWDLYAPIYEKAMLAERLNSSGNAPLAPSDPYCDCGYHQKKL
ncbi:MAG: hypothetical protein IJ639_02845 [Ruminococcus sp.]|nr:hypothetical protein [Ruminococcus sp.]